MSNKQAEGAVALIQSTIQQAIRASNPFRVGMVTDDNALEVTLPNGAKLLNVGNITSTKLSNGAPIVLISNAGQSSLAASAGTSPIFTGTQDSRAV